MLHLEYFRMIELNINTYLEHVKKNISQKVIFEQYHFQPIIQHMGYIHTVFSSANSCDKNCGKPNKK